MQIAAVMGVVFAFVFLFLGVTHVSELQTLTAPSITNTAVTALFGNVSFYQLMLMPVAGVVLLIGISVMLLGRR
jgi:putative copper export protein